MKKLKISLLCFGRRIFIFLRVLLTVPAPPTALAPLAAPVLLPNKQFKLFFGKNLLEPCYQDVKYFGKPAAVHKILERSCFCPENTRTKAHTHVVVVHFVDILAGDDLLLEVENQVDEDALVERRQL